MYNNVSERWLICTPVSVPLSLVWFRASTGGSWAAAPSPLGGFWIQGLCSGKGSPRGGELPCRLAGAWTRPQVAAPRPEKAWVWAGSTMKGRQCCTDAPGSGTLTLPHSSNSLEVTPCLSFPAKRVGACEVAAVAGWDRGRGRAEGDLPGKGRDWGAQGWLGVISLQPWLSPSNPP